jgi:D-alanine-D-alanine ligase
MKVVILCDRTPEPGADPDQLDGLIQADTVSRALSDLGHESRVLNFSLDLKALLDDLQRKPPDRVFNLVESVEGRGRFLCLAPLILDFWGIPYTGAPTDALYVTSNKLLSKKILEGAGLPTPRCLPMEQAQSGKEILEGPYIIKSVWEHASIGMGDDSVVSDPGTKALYSEMKRRQHALGGACFAEQYIEGREFNLSLLAKGGGFEALQPAEIRFDNFPVGKRKIVGYDAKWNEESFEFHHTRRSFEFSEKDAALLDQLAATAEHCWRLFGLRGYARVDFRVDGENRPWVLEVNANPCLSPDAGFAAAARQSGLDYQTIIERILDDSVFPEGQVVKCG